MKKHTSIPMAIALLAIAFTSHAGTIKMPAGPNLSRNAGQTIPIAFNASGWSPGQTAQVWLINAWTWSQDLVWIDQPVHNGNNQLELTIPWSWFTPAPYLVKIVAGNAHCTGTQLVQIRGAIICPYGGTTLNRGQGAWVTWTTGLNNAEYFRVSVINESTGFSQVVGEADPSAGRLWFQVPNMVGSGFRIAIVGFVLIEEEDDYYFEDEVEYTQSERVNIR